MFTEKDFCFWLAGFYAGKDAEPLTAHDSRLIKQRLEMIQYQPAKVLKGNGPSVKHIEPIKPAPKKA